MSKSLVSLGLVIHSSPRVGWNAVPPCWYTTVLMFENP